MRTFDALSIRAKLIAIVMVTTCAALALVASTLATFDAVSHRRSLKKELQTIAQITGENSTAALTFENADDARSVLTALRSQPDVISACLYRPRGDLFASYVRPDAGRTCPAQPISG